MNTDISRHDERELETVGEREVVPPRVDIFENQDEYLLVADLPGVSRDDLNIHLNNERLAIHGRVVEEDGDGELSREYRAFDYRRHFVIPEAVDRDRIAAKLEQGVLWLHLPKADAVKPRRIQVQSG